MWRVVKIERTRLAQRLGRRGLLLLLSGLAWIGVGTNIIRNNMARFSQPGPDADLILQFMDSNWIGWLWVFAGAAALVVVIFRGTRWPKISDAIGYNAILTPPMIWTLAFLWSYVTYIMSNGEYGRSTSLYSLIVWSLITLFILVIAGWPEPTTRGEPPKNGFGSRPSNGETND